MSIWKRLASWIIKAFRTGPAIIDRSDAVWGHGQELYAPSKYSHYLATSVAVYRCTDLRAKNLAQLPPRLWKLDREGNRTEVTSGRLYELLRRPNPFWTWRRLIHMTELTLGAWGQCYWVLERGETGRRPPTEIWWARPDKMRPVPHEQNYLAGFVYEDRGTQIAFTAGEVVWFRYPNPLDEFSGLSPIAAARLSIDAGHGAIRSNMAVFDQGLQMAGVISPEDKSDRWPKEEVERLQELLSKRFKGVDKAHRVMVLSHAAKFSPVSLSPKDAQFVELMRWSKGEVATVYGVAPELIGDHEHATYSNFEQAEKSLWTDTLVPESEFLAEELTHQLVPLFPGEADLLELDRSQVSVLQEDGSAIVEQMFKLWQMGVPLNRLLQEFKPNLLPERGDGYPWGDVGYVGLGRRPAGSSAAPEEETPREGETLAEEAARALHLFRRYQATQADKAVVQYGSPEHERIWRAFTRRTDRREEKVRDAMRELFRRQQESVLARLREGRSSAAGIVEKAAIEDEPFDRAEWGGKFKQQMLPLLREILEEAGEETLDEIGVSVAFDVASPEAVRFLERRAQRFAREVNATTWGELKRTLAEGIDAGEGIPELSERVRTVFTDASTRRAEVIARTEVIGASNGGALIAAKQSGVVEGKEWLSALDERTRETHMAAHGQRVAINDDFQVGAGRGPAPGQIGLAEEDINCRCTMTWVVSEKSAGRRNGHGALIGVGQAPRVGG